MLESHVSVGSLQDSLSFGMPSRVTRCGDLDRVSRRLGLSRDTQTDKFPRDRQPLSCLALSNAALPGVMMNGRGARHASPSSPAPSYSGSPAGSPASPDSPRSPGCQSTTHREPRLLMREWLQREVEAGRIEGLQYMNPEKTLVRIPWLHGSRNGWAPGTHSELYRQWAIHTGKYESKREDAKRWKANFRCALNSLPDVKEVKEESQKRGQNAYKVYRLLPQKRRDSSCVTRPKVKQEFPMCVESTSNTLPLDTKQFNVLPDPNTPHVTAANSTASPAVVPSSGHPSSHHCWDSDEEQPDEHSYAKTPYRCNELPIPVMALVHKNSQSWDSEQITTDGCMQVSYSLDGSYSPESTTSYSDEEYTEVVNRLLVQQEPTAGIAMLQDLCAPPEQQDICTAPELEARGTPGLDMGGHRLPVYTADIDLKPSDIIAQGPVTEQLQPVQVLGQQPITDFSAFIDGAKLGGARSEFTIHGGFMSLLNG